MLTFIYMPITRFTFPMGRFIPIPFSLSCSFPSSIYILLSTFIFMFQVLFHFHILFHFYLQCSLSYSCLCSCLCSFSFPVSFFHVRPHFPLSCPFSFPCCFSFPCSFSFSHQVGMKSHTKWITGHTRHKLAWCHKTAWGRHGIPYKVNRRPHWAQNRMRPAWNPIHSKSPAILGTRPYLRRSRMRSAWIPIRRARC